MPTVAVILPAAGKSSRFGGKEKKPFVSLDGRPVWQRSAELFWTRDDVSKVYLIVSPDDREEFRRRFTHLIAFANAELIDGGAERFDSVANALARVPETVDLVAVPTPRQLVLLAVFGAVQMAFPYWLFARGLKTVGPQEAGIITLLEPLLNPVWAYLITPATDTPNRPMFLGGGLILAALVWRYAKFSRV